MLVSPPAAMTGRTMMTAAAAAPVAAFSNGRTPFDLARAMAIDPEFILYDEPTTGLDPIMADAINDLIRSLQKKLTITSVAVTHDMRSAYRIGDRIAMLHDGKIIYEGTPHEIQKCEDPAVCQFISGSGSGPLTDS